MNQHDQPITDERPTLVPEASGAGEQPTVGDEQPSNGGSRFALPRIRWARTAATTIKIGIFVVAISAALGVAAFVAASFYSQYGVVRNTPNAHGWAGLTARYAGQATCASCHLPEAAAQGASAHVSVSCEGCHGPAAAHSISAAAVRAAVLTGPAAAICDTCHAATAGRPTTFPQVDTARHYSGGQCLRCHDPHSIVAVRPPIVSHPLAKLPECTTCHAPDGLTEIPTGHEIVPDTVCLSCHSAAANGKP